MGASDMVRSMMAQAASGTAALMSRQRKGGEDSLEKERRTAVRKAMESAVKSGNSAQVEALAPYAKRVGVDPELYTAQIKTMPPLASAQGSFDNAIASFFNQLSSGQPRSSAPPQALNQQPGAAPGAENSGAPAAPNPNPSAAAAQEQKTPVTLEQLFTPDFLVRSTLKKLSGIDVGAHYHEAPLWYKRYGERINRGQSKEEAVDETAVEFGFIPDGASSLSDIPEWRRNALFERELAAKMHDPITEQHWKQVAAPRVVNSKQAKLGYVLDLMASNGRYINPHYQPILDRFRGLDDPKYIGSDEKEWIFKHVGLRPGEYGSDVVALASKAIEDEAIIKASRVAAATTTGRIMAENELEAQKVISAEDVAKFGVQYPTYYDIAAAGKRFPSEKERDTYTQLQQAREKLLSLGQLMFGVQLDPKTLEPVRDAKGGLIGNPQDGIFGSIESGALGQLKGKMSIAWDEIQGTTRGQYAKRYRAVLADIARTLLIIDRDLRPSDPDVVQMRNTLAKLGNGLFDLPTSAPDAHYLLKRWVSLNNKVLDQLLKETTIGKPETPQPLTPRAGKKYKFSDGTTRIFKGNDKNGNPIYEEEK